LHPLFILSPLYFGTLEELGLTRQYCIDITPEHIKPVLIDLQRDLFLIQGVHGRLTLTRNSDAQPEPDPSYATRINSQPSFGLARQFIA
jgi:hypothetical protein